MLCEEARELIIAHARSETTAEEAARLEEHLRGCSSCRQEAERARRMLAVAEAAYDPRVDERVRDLIQRAVREGASDIHFDPAPEGLIVRFRVDGALKEVERHPRLMLQPMVDRLLALGRIAPDVIDFSRRRPAGGWASVSVDGTEFRLRIGAFPMIHGPKAVVRVLAVSEKRLTLAELGLRDEDRERLGGWVRRPHGLVLVVGPPGSGKTTTQYALTEICAQPESNVLTLERNVDAQLPGVHQALVNPAEDLGFAKSLRAIFRHLDPDVIMVGDVPDAETARILPDLAITGHGVIAGFEAGSAVTAIRRLLDLGADPYTLAQTLVGVCAQRLPRRICPKCRTERPASAIPMQALGLDPNDAPKLYGGAGCVSCRRRGYTGRVGVFELLESTPALAQRIAEDAPVASLAEAAGSSLSPLLDDARRKVLDGTTTPDEAFRVIRTGFA
jgi:general secretion pathway protein E